MDESLYHLPTWWCARMAQNKGRQSMTGAVVRRLGPRGSLPALLILATLVSGCWGPTPHLDEIKALPEFNLAYPGATLYHEVDSEGTGIVATKDAYVQLWYRVATATKADDILAWYQGKLASYGWTYLPDPADYERYSWIKDGRTFAVDTASIALGTDSIYTVEIGDNWGNLSPSPLPSRTGANSD